MPGWNEVTEFSDFCLPVQLQIPQLVVNKFDCSPIKVVEQDKIGVVTDGPTPGIDVDYQRHTGALTVTFAGFESVMHGIFSHHVSVGTEPKRDDVVSYTDAYVIAKDVNGIGKLIL